VELLRREKPEFIAPDMWPLNSPDITTVDYCVWGVMQEIVYHTPIEDKSATEGYEHRGWLPADCNKRSN